MTENNKNNMLPYIGKNRFGVDTLYVKGEPYLMIGGELHNSAASSLEYMEKEVWPYIRPLSLNTIILPMPWENIEPEEGVFDFSLMEGLIEQARRENMKLVVLWFGLWKNGESFYTPSWVKEDYERFVRSRYADRHPSNTISPFCKAAVEADKKAFVRLMEFLKEKDSKENTVVMVQVENEIGFLKAPRDYGEIANAAMKEQIPDALASLYNVEGTWEDAFGEDAEENLMAWQYGCDVNEIASAGKKVYNLPMYVNAWLEQHPDRPGEYPSGGPVAKLIPLWKAAAPAIDLIAPDIYVPDFKGTCEAYKACGNAMFIPEARRDPITASNAIYAFAGLNAMGFSPFAVEDFHRNDLKLPDLALLVSLNIDMSGFNCFGTAPYYQKTCEILTGMLPLLKEYQGSEELIGFIRSNPWDRGCILPMGDYDLELDYPINMGDKTGSAGMILKKDGGFYITGCNVKFKPLPKKGSGEFVTMARLQEGVFEKGIWKPGRILNGDELSQCNLGEFAETKFVKVCVHRA